MENQTWGKAGSTQPLLGTGGPTDQRVYSVDFGWAVWPCLWTQQSSCSHSHSLAHARVLVVFGRGPWSVRSSRARFQFRSQAWGVCIDQVVVALLLFLLLHLVLRLLVPLLLPWPPPCLGWPCLPCPCVLLPQPPGPFPPWPLVPGRWVSPGQLWRQPTLAGGG